MFDTAAKTCRGCDETKPLEHFSRHSGFKDGRNSKCKTCKNAMAKAYYRTEQGLANDRAKAKRRWREGGRTEWLTEKYGITSQEYDDLLEQQGGACAICGDLSGKRSLDVDHCHTTGAVRGLLCWNCNMGLGVFKDSPDRLRGAIAYLQAATAKRAA